MRRIRDIMWPELKIVTIGGGSGAKQVLKALRLLTDPPKFPHTKCKLNAIVSMVDDGGSLGRLRMGSFSSQWGPILPRMNYPVPVWAQV